METKIFENYDYCMNQESFEAFRSNMLLFEQELETQITSFLTSKINKPSDEDLSSEKKGKEKNKTFKSNQNRDYG